MAVLSHPDKLNKRRVVFLKLLSGNTRAANLILTRRFTRRAVKWREGCFVSLEWTIILEQMGLNVPENLIIASMEY